MSLEAERKAMMESRGVPPAIREWVAAERRQFVEWLRREADRYAEQGHPWQDAYRTAALKFEKYHPFGHKEEMK